MGLFFFIFLENVVYSSRIVIFLRKEIVIPIGITIPRNRSLPNKRIILPLE
jgi:predicted TIM-barrel enzyme